jgi:hypothetical protein
MTPIPQTADSASVRHSSKWVESENLPDGTLRLGQFSRRFCFFQVILLSEVAAIVAFHENKSPRPFPADTQCENSPNHFPYMREVFLLRSKSTTTQYSKQS